MVNIPDKIEGKSAEEWYADGGANYSAKDFPKVIECYENAIKIGLKDKRNLKMALYNTGNAYFFLQNYQKGYEYYKKAAKLDSTFVFAFYGIGTCSFHLKNFKEAIKMLEKSLKIDPKHQIILPNRNAAFRFMGDAYKELNNIPKAIECYNSALKFEPNDEMAKKNLELIQQKK